MTQPNIIFIITDQWRGDCLSVSGHPVLETPNLDEVARNGTWFQRAYSACPSCIAARAALMCGQTPSTLGRLGYRDSVPWRYKTTMMTELAAGGYQTHCVGKTHFYPQRAHLGFHSMEAYEALQNQDGDFINDYHAWLVQQPGGPWDEQMHGLDSNSWIARPSHLPEHLHVNSWTIERSLHFIRRRDPMRPFFLNISFHRPHPPNDPPAEYFHMYDNATLPPIPRGKWAAEHNHPVDGVNAGSGRLPKAMADRQRRAYWGQISHIDQMIGRLLVYLRRVDLMKNTILVFTSDHGELLGDHDTFRKTTSLEGSAKIPLIISAPPRFKLATKHTTDLPVTHMDLMPTLLEMVGLPVPEHVEGSSLMPLLRDDKGNDWRQFVHGEHAAPGSKAGGVQFLVGSRYKYTWYTGNGRELLFDLVDDPQEMVNLADQEASADLLEQMRGELVKVLNQRPQDGLTDGQRLVPGKNLPSVRPELLEPWYDNEGVPRPRRDISAFADVDTPGTATRFWPLKD